MLDSAATFLSAVNDWGVSALSLPTAYWHEITASLGAEIREMPPSLRLIIIAGERALPQRLARWHEYVGQSVRLINTYGLTESTIISTLGELTEAEQTAGQLREVPVGRPIRNTQVYILDRNLQPAPIGAPGELHIGGLLLARGYFDRPDATAERFAPNPYSLKPGARIYKTGDMARYLPDSNIEFLGRNDNQVKIRGFRVELNEIESALSRHPFLRDVAVIAREHSRGEKRVLAYVVAAPDHNPTTGELRSFLREELPEYMMPSAFISMDALPLTPNGKVDRAALPAPDGVRPTLEVDYAPPRTTLEQEITRAWQEALNVEAVGIHDNFFDLGGHSLSIIQLRNKLQSSIGKELTIAELFAYPTVNSLAEHISAEASQPPPAQSSSDDVGARRDTRRRRKELRQQAQAKIG
jgi:acyl-coenzyme A synthetase/AMP-(fatty) acid ligase/acyl carrier protein